VRVRAVVTGELDLDDSPSLAGRSSEAGGALAARSSRVQIEATAVAEAGVPVGGAGGAAGMPTMASGGGYSGPLVYRTGEGMRPDVAAAFDRMAAVAAKDGVTLIVNSGFRSDAEQAALFAANPDPRMVAPPGQSLHRCATELDLGPESAYGWLAGNATRFGFVQRYSWEAWHYGFTAGPAPCSVAGNAVTAAGGGGDGALAGTTLPSFVPAQYRAMILRAATRWNVSAALLAGQLMAESGFDPDAGSPAGAQGIAQFMPATAAAYGLRNPYDPAEAIDAQAHLMADLLHQFGDPALALAAYNAGPAPVEACDCIPDYPETQAYVTRIFALLGGAGALAVPSFEVRLVG
jgi:Transglycosylase SLT domain/D-alanyl-D-alanine carboxypeptidase